MLTAKDISAIENHIRVIFREEFPKEFEREFKKHLSYLPTKKEFFDSMDKLMIELRKIRESYEIFSPRVGNHEERIGRIETHLHLPSLAD